MSSNDGAGRQVSATRTIGAPASTIFDVLCDPSLHAVIDGSGSVRATRGKPERLALNSTFQMKMRMGLPYLIRNTVVEFEQDRLIAWSHFGGHRWRYRLDPADQVGSGDAATMVTETFDWSPSASPLRLYIEKLGWPARHLPAMERTLERLDAFVTNRDDAL